MFNFAPSAPQAQTRRLKVKAQVTTEIEIDLSDAPDRTPIRFLGSPAPEGMQSPRPEEKQEKPKRWCGLC